ncbi:hypothetical protein N7452_001789 [Penicillium brevicompactum]|uniref:Uncharacterized protein n=1 Tax=Penicillium brevicompactum TaxID=5074 RepID=A0A9W9R4M8_PENBR|nr:hypothetical protein N7452_001789 [Penicillium brevicompactum]
MGQSSKSRKDLLQYTEDWNPIEEAMALLSTLTLGTHHPSTSGIPNNPGQSVRLSVPEKQMPAREPGGSIAEPESICKITTST